MAKITPTCKACGHTSILRDAFAEWNNETQEWVLQNTFDHCICDNCGDENNWEWI